MNVTDAMTKISAIVLGIHQRHGGSLSVLEPDWALLHPDLQIDSLDLAEIMAELEVEFGISPFERGTPKTWGDVVNLIVEPRSMAE
jgi:acyl carrier protein